VLLNFIQHIKAHEIEVTDAHARFLAWKSVLRKRGQVHWDLL